MIIAVWGTSGSGKTTLATQLGCELARTKLSLVVAGSLTHSSVQHFFGITERRKSLKNVLHDTDSLADNVINYQQQKNLFLLDLSSVDNCLQQTDITDDQAEKLLSAAKRLFEVLIIDCAVSYNNPITRAAFLHSSQVLHVLLPTPEAVSFALSHQILFSRLNLESKMLIILNQDRKTVRHKNIAKILDNDIDIALPFCCGINRSSTIGVPLNISGSRSREEGKYLAKLKALANLLAGSKSLSKRVLG